MLYVHNPKTGGTFLIRHLAAAVGTKNLRVAEENSRAGNAGSAKAFVVGSVREPCHQYVSLWAYGSRKQGSFHSTFLRTISNNSGNASWVQDKYFAARRSLFLNESNDIACFRRWVTHPLVLGVITARVATMFTWVPQVDCWVTTGSNMVSEMKGCLKQFAAQGGIVDWGTLEFRLNASVVLNHVHHGECEQYFDERFKRTVRARDAPLYSYFGWTHCCSDAASKVQLNSL